jgi:type IV secretion system protein VirD4
VNEFALVQDDAPEDAARQRQALRRRMQGVVRQAALDPADDLGPTI